MNALVVAIACERRRARRQGGSAARRVRRRRRPTERRRERVWTAAAAAAADEAPPRSGRPAPPRGGPPPPARSAADEIDRAPPLSPPPPPPGGATAIATPEALAVPFSSSSPAGAGENLSRVPPDAVSAPGRQLLPPLIGRPSDDDPPPSGTSLPGDDPVLGRAPRVVADVPPAAPRGRGRDRGGVRGGVGVLRRARVRQMAPGPCRRRARRVGGTAETTPTRPERRRGHLMAVRGRAGREVQRVRRAAGARERRHRPPRRRRGTSRAETRAGSSRTARGNARAPGSRARRPRPGRRGRGRRRGGLVRVPRATGRAARDRPDPGRGGRRDGPGVRVRGPGAFPRGRPPLAPPRENPAKVPRGRPRRGRAALEAQVSEKTTRPRRGGHTRRSRPGPSRALGRARLDAAKRRRRAAAREGSRGPSRGVSAPLPLGVRRGARRRLPRRGRGRFPEVSDSRGGRSRAGAPPGPRRPRREDA